MSSPLSYIKSSGGTVDAAVVDSEYAAIVDGLLHMCDRTLPFKVGGVQVDDGVIVPRPDLTNRAYCIIDNPNLIPYILMRVSGTIYGATLYYVSPETKTLMSVNMDSTLYYQVPISLGRYTQYAVVVRKVKNYAGGPDIDPDTYIFTQANIDSLLYNFRLMCAVNDYLGQFRDHIMFGRRVIPVELGGFSIDNIYTNINNTARCRTQIIQVAEPSTMKFDPQINPDLTFRCNVYEATKGLVHSRIPAGGTVNLSIGTYRVSIESVDSSGVNQDITTNDLWALCNSIIVTDDDSPLLSQGSGIQGTDVVSSRMLGVFKKFTAVGDSLTCGYTSKGGTTHNSEEAKTAGNNWPTYLCTELGRELTNVAIGGTTARDWRNTHVNTANVDTDCYFVGLGVNDARQNLVVGTSADIASDKASNADSFYGNLDYVVRQLLEYQPNAHIFMFTMLFTESNAETYNAAIRHIAGLYDNVHLIDTYQYYEDNPSAKNFIASTWDGHSTPTGYMYMAGVIKVLIAEYMVSNSSKFFSVPY